MLRAGALLYSPCTTTFPVSGRSRDNEPEMTRTLHACYKWLARPKVIGYAGLLILLLTLVLCLANFGLTKYVVIGALAGIMLWKWPAWVRFLLGLAILLTFVAACTNLEEATPAPKFYWPATYTTQITLGSSGRNWTVSEQLTVPGDALRQITEGTGHYSVQLPPPGPGQYQKDIDSLAQMVRQDGLVLTGVENGTDPIFSFPPVTLTHQLPLLPLITTQDVSLFYEALPGDVNIIPGAGSSVTITGPSELIGATTPASQAEATTTGEERVIEAGSLTTTGGAGSVSISISTLSTLARAEPMRFLAGLSLSTGITWAIGAIWALLAVLLKTEAETAAESAWKRVRRSKATASEADQAGRKDAAGTPARPKDAPARTGSGPKKKQARPKKTAPRRPG